MNIISYLIFAFVTTITPGPNNFLLFSYGKTYGVRKTISVMAGIALGFFTILCLSGYGLGNIITTNTMIAFLLKVIASIWFLYLAYLIRKLNVNKSDSPVKKIGFKEAYVMQFINPKAWIMALGGAALFLPDLSNIHLSVFTYSVIFNLVGIPSMLIWTYSGSFLSNYLNSNRLNNIFGYIMSALMVLSVLLVWIV